MTHLTVKLFHEDRSLKVVNPEDDWYYQRLFAVSFAKIIEPELVYASHTQEAIDIFADYATEQGWHGLFLEPDDEWTKELEGFGEVSYVGNEGKPVNDDEIFVREVTYQKIKRTYEIFAIETKEITQKVWYRVEAYDEEEAEEAVQEYRVEPHFFKAEHVFIVEQDIQSIEVFEEGE